jgi:hypothetical protein
MGRENTLSKEEIEKRLQKYDLNISVSNNKLTAIAKPKKETWIGIKD